MYVVICYVSGQLVMQCHKKWRSLAFWMFSVWFTASACGACPGFCQGLIEGCLTFSTWLEHADEIPRPPLLHAMQLGRTPWTMTAIDLG